MYISADNVPNNWVSAFGGSAWSQEEKTGRYYYHRYYPEQPSLNWANPQVRRSMHEVIRFWADRGVDGFRLDALDGIAVDSLLRDEPPAHWRSVRTRRPVTCWFSPEADQGCLPAFFT